MKDYVELNES